MSAMCGAVHQIEEVVHRCDKDAGHAGSHVCGFGICPIQWAAGRVEVSQTHQNGDTK